MCFRVFCPCLATAGVDRLPSKRQVLVVLPRSVLQEFVNGYELGEAVSDRRVKDQLVDALVASRRVKLEDVLGELARPVGKKERIDSWNELENIIDLKTPSQLG